MAAVRGAAKAVAGHTLISSASGVIAKERSQKGRKGCASLVNGPRGINPASLGATGSQNSVPTTLPTMAMPQNGAGIRRRGAATSGVDASWTGTGAE